MISETYSQAAGAKYLLDACIPVGIQELSYEYVESTKILPQGTPDQTVLETAKKHGLIVITMDKKFVQRAMSERTPIIWQNNEGERYLIHGELITSGCVRKSFRAKRTKYLLRNDEIIAP